MTPTPEDEARAREIAEDVCDGAICFPAMDGPHAPIVCPLIGEIASALAAERAATVEACVQLVRHWSVELLGVNQSPTSVILAELADAISAQQPPAGLHSVLAKRGASVSASEGRVLVDVLTERTRQDAKWGEQNHPSVDAVLMGRSGGCGPERMADEYEIPWADRAKALCDDAAERGECTWAHIAVEELCEAVEAAVESDAACRGELVQLAAVIVAWIQCIDRRASAPKETP